MPFWHALAGLIRRPQQILFLWNWKAALLSVALRGPIFLAATMHRDVATILSAILTEIVFCMATAGFYGAIIQYLRDAEPEWLTLVFLTVVMPAIFQVLEFALHRLRGTPHLRAAEIVSIVVSGISALFNWFAMRRGALLIGVAGDTFRSDVYRLPRLIFSFVIAPFSWLFRQCSGRRVL